MMMRVPQAEIDGPVVALRDAALHDLLRVQQERSTALLGLEDELVELLLRALTRLVEDELRLAPEHVRAIARSELQRLGDEHRAILYVHPDDLPHVATLNDASSTVGLSVEADAALARGDCVVASEIGSVDARMSTKLERLRALIGEGHAR